MKRIDLEHILRAAAAITQHTRFLIIGSQSILATVHNPEGVLGLSEEADIMDMDDPRSTDLAEGMLGELSLFHETFGYYMQAVDSNTAILPNGWELRLKRLEAQGINAIGLALEPNDLAVSKLAAGREKDGPFVAALFSQGLASPAIVRERIQEVPIGRLSQYGMDHDVLVSRLDMVLREQQKNRKKYEP